jgi:hypothetical protein
MECVCQEQDAPPELLRMIFTNGIPSALEADTMSPPQFLNRRLPAKSPNIYSFVQQMVDFKGFL